MLKMWNRPRFAVTLASFCLFMLCSVVVQGQQTALQDRPIFDIVRSGDGQVFALDFEGSSAIDLIDAYSGDLIHRANLSENPRRITLNPTGDQFLWTNSNGSIHLYDVLSGSDDVIVIGGAALVGPLLWNPTDDIVAISAGISVDIYDISTNILIQPGGSPTYLRSEDTGRVVDLAWSPDGEFLATSHYSQNLLDPSIMSREMQIWSPIAGEIQSIPLVRYDDRGGGSVEWNPDGTLLALLANNELVIYDFIADAFVEELTFDDRNPFTVVWSPTGDYLATGGTMIRIWDTETWEVVATLPAESYVSAIQWSPDGQQLYSNRGAEGLSIDSNPAQVEDE